MSVRNVPWEAVKNLIGEFPRRKLAHLPTPLQPLNELSKELGVNLWVKRDDLTGLAMGGNKGRKLEFVMADALTQGAQSIVTWAGVQSNWCCQLSAAARMCGIRPILILFKRPGLPSGLEGNALLDSIYGAEIHRVDLGKRSMMDLESVRDLVEEIVARERAAGRKCYVAPIGASMTGGSMNRPLGGIGFLNAAVELLEQAQERNIDLDAVVFATGSGGMQAGLIAGSRILCPRIVNVGISVSDSRVDISRAVETIVEQLMAYMPPAVRQSANVASDDVVAFDDYIDRGYGILNRATVENMEKMARAEGLLLDPVYTGRTFVGMIDLIAKGYFRPGANIVLLHTGGTAALFAYGQGILDNLESRQ